MDREPTDERATGVPEYYVVELVEGERRRYVLCQRMLVIEEGDDSDGPSPEFLDGLFARKPLRAVVLPTAGRGRRWLQRGGGWPQLGHNVNININLPPDP